MDREAKVTSDKKIILAGTLFVITDGEYDDYGIRTLCKAEVDIDIDALQLEYLGKYPSNAADYEFQEDLFILWLIEKEYASELEMHELHIGSYGIINLEYSDPSASFGREARMKNLALEKKIKEFHEVESR